MLKNHSIFWTTFRGADQCRYVVLEQPKLSQTEIFNKYILV